jgi:transposase
MSAERRLKYNQINRDQMGWVTLDIESLIPADHRARIIWQVVGRMDMSGFEADIRTLEGEGGRPAWPPQLLASIWIYAYTLGTPSARALERMMAWEPGLRWLAALEVINHHTLSSFRVEHGEALSDFFAQQLAALEQEGLLDWSVLMQDGTKMEAKAGKESYRRQPHIAERVRVAREAMSMLEQQAEDSEIQIEKRVQAAQFRAARERVERMEAALASLRERQENTEPSGREQVRVSTSEPEARKMKHPDGGWRLSYNVQTTTSAGAGNFLVGVGVTASEADARELVPAIERVEQRGKVVQQLVADGGYVSRENVSALSEKSIALVAPWKPDESREAGALTVAGIDRAYGASRFKILDGEEALECPRGNRLPLTGTRTPHGVLQKIYQAEPSDCRSCPVRRDCCGKRAGARRIARPIESQPMRDFITRMQEPATQALYKRRKQVAEWPHLWIKSLFGIRRFSVRGQHKAGLEMLWIALAYNIEQWIRVRPTATA